MPLSYILINTNIQETDFFVLQTNGFAKGLDAFSTFTRLKTITGGGRAITD